ncbi:MAG TPA: hypothetical protein VIO94_09190, partial [Phenylobacterium sp.]
MTTEERTVITRDAAGDPVVAREEIRETGATTHVVRENNTGAWWLAAFVAIVAIVGLLWLFNSNQTDVADLEAARDAGRTEAMMDVANAQAQSAALAAQAATQNTSAEIARA